MNLNRGLLSRSQYLNNKWLIWKKESACSKVKMSSWLQNNLVLKVKQWRWETKCSSCLNTKMTWKCCWNSPLTLWNKKIGKLSLLRKSPDPKILSLSRRKQRWGDLSRMQRTSVRRWSWAKLKLSSLCKLQLRISKIRLRKEVLKLKFLKKWLKQVI
jgi:hypothetical protein